MSLKPDLDEADLGWAALDWTDLGNTDWDRNGFWT
jgi:hypothetical protein